jgi:hypothetical protein
MGTRQILSSVRIFLTSFVLLLLFSFTPSAQSAQSATTKCAIIAVC